MIDLFLYLNHVLASAIIWQVGNKPVLLVRNRRGPNSEVNFLIILKYRHVIMIIGFRKRKNSNNQFVNMIYIDVHLNIVIKNKIEK